jgi:4-hydroxybenzoate polyprenyltransferase
MVRLLPDPWPGAQRLGVDGRVPMSRGAGAQAVGPGGGATSYLRCIRYMDVLVLQGSPILGALYALDRFTVDAIPRLLLFGVASCLLVAHVFSFNDWAGIAADGNDPNKAGNNLLALGVSPRSIALLSLVLLGASLLLFAVLGGPTLLLATAIAALGVVYSHPAIDAKGTPLVSSIPHVLGGLLHFSLGYSLFGAVDARALLIALYFALTFTAGHLNQEVRDHDGDRRNDIRTNAVRFGRTPVFVASVLIFTLAYAHLGFLAATGRVPGVLAVVLLLYPLHAAWSWRALRAGLTFSELSRLSSRYRGLYAVIGLIMLAALLAR